MDETVSHVVWAVLVHITFQYENWSFVTNMNSRRLQQACLVKDKTTVFIVTS